MFVNVLVFMMIFVTFVFMFVRQMNVKLHPFNLGLLFSRGVKVVTVQMQLFEFVLQSMKIDAEIEHRADEHVAADAAENIEVKCFHFV